MRVSGQHSSRWTIFLAANAIPIVATLALVWLATVSLVVVNYFVPLNLVPLVYMLPVVLAATQWGIVPGLMAAFTGAAAADFFFLSAALQFLVGEPSGYCRSASLSIGRHGHEQSRGTPQERDGGLSAGAKKRSRNSTPFRKASPPALPTVT